MDIHPPKGSSCYEYDVRSVCKEVDETEFSTIAQLIRDRTVLFPMPVHDQGRAFSKPREYLTAAFHHAEVSKDDVEGKLDQLTAILNEDRTNKGSTESVPGDQIKEGAIISCLWRASEARFAR